MFYLEAVEQARSISLILEGIMSTRHDFPGHLNRFIHCHSPPAYILYILRKKLKKQEFLCSVIFVNPYLCFSFLVFSL